jgi:hypothetical protein
MATSSSNPAYRAALALNNMGVSLLETSCIDQALVTLLDAFSVIKLACGGSGASTTRREGGGGSAAWQSTIDVDYKLQQAYERYSHRQPALSSLIVGAVSDDPTATEVETVVRSAQDPRDSGKVFPVRIESTSSSLSCPPDSSSVSGCEDSEQASLSCNVVLHNLGLAYLCMAQRCEGSRSRLFSEKGATILHLCDQVLVSLSEKTSTCQRVHEFRRVMFLGLVSTLSYRHFAGPHPSLAQRVKLMAAGINQLNTSCVEYSISNKSPSFAPAA